jgi:hypothetical protein
MQACKLSSEFVAEESFALSSLSPSTDSVALC